ncbi:hypothetical protein [Mycobacterium sp.]|uniref:hypothetical protein n=1 Tax=Mycobacterium sp. TaxID=1785 RepID=UPI003F9D1706
MTPVTGKLAERALRAPHPANQVPAEIIEVRALAHHESFAHERIPELGGVNEQTVAGVALSCDQNGHAHN